VRQSLEKGWLQVCIQNMPVHTPALKSVASKSDALYCTVQYVSKVLDANILGHHNTRYNNLKYQKPRSINPKYQTPSIKLLGIKILGIKILGIKILVSKILVSKILGIKILCMNILAFFQKLDPCLQKPATEPLGFSGLLKPWRHTQYGIKIPMKLVQWKSLVSILA
jgi:hypothetical protein